MLTEDKHQSLERYLSGQGRLTVVDAPRIVTVAMRDIPVRGIVGALLIEHALPGDWVRTALAQIGPAVRVSDRTVWATTVVRGLGITRSRGEVPHWLRDMSDVVGI
jgi:hypothetical protein